MSTPHPSNTYSHLPQTPTHPLRRISTLHRLIPLKPKSKPDHPLPLKPRRRRRTIRKRFSSFLYHSSFYVFILIIAMLLVGAAYGLGEQAYRTGGMRRWNLVMLSGSYVALFIISLTHIWSRVLSIRKALRTIPKPYIPIKQIDVPKAVADHIMTEYSRTAVIAHISQATTGQQEGWGRPGTKWENQHFRTYILGTLATMRSTLTPSRTQPQPPTSLQPLFTAADLIPDKGATRLFINSYAKIIDKALYSRREPDEGDAGAVEKILDVVVLSCDVRKRRQEEESALVD